MSTQLFGAPDAGGSFADKLAKARGFLDQARGNATPATVEVAATHGLAAEAPVEAAAAAPVEVAPGAAAPTGVGEQAVVTTAAGHDPDGLAAAARAAAEQSIQNPAYATAATQQVDVLVQPRVMVQGQQGQIIVPVDIAVPAAQTNVTVAPAQAVVLDPATGQIVAAPAAAPAAVAGQVADTAAPTRGFRNWGIEDLAALGRGRGATTPAAAPVATVVTPTAGAAAEVPAAGGGGWRAQVENLLTGGRGGATPAAQPAAAEVVVDAPAATGGGWKARVEDALGLPKAGGASAPVAEVVTDTPAAVRGGGWRGAVEDALGLAKAGGGAPVAEVVADAGPKVSLLDRIRANTAGIGEVLTRTAPEAAPVADDVAKAAAGGLGAELRAAVAAAKAVR